MSLYWEPLTCHWFLIRYCNWNQTQNQYLLLSTTLQKPFKKWTERVDWANPQWELPQHQGPGAPPRWTRAPRAQGRLLCWEAENKPALPGPRPLKRSYLGKGKETCSGTRTAKDTGRAAATGRRTGSRGRRHSDAGGWEPNQNNRELPCVLQRPSKHPAANKSSLRQQREGQ